MKKAIKVLMAAVISLTMMFSFAQPVSYAFDSQNALNTLEQKVQNSSVDTGKASDIGAAVINWIWGISIVVAVVVLMITGLKFIVGSTNEKAEYKKSLIPLVVGVLILVFATTIVKVLFSIK